MLLFFCGPSSCRVRVSSRIYSWILCFGRKHTLCDASAKCSQDALLSYKQSWGFCWSQKMWEDQKAMSSVIPHRQCEGDWFRKMPALSFFLTLFCQTKLLIFAYAVTDYCCEKTVGSGGLGSEGCYSCGGRRMR